MSVTVNVTSNIDELAKKFAEKTEKAQNQLTQQAAKDTEPFVPFLTGSLTERTQVEDNEIIYPGPYARYLYYGKTMAGGGAYGSIKAPTNKDLVFTKTFHPKAQSHWFEASKALNIEKWKQVYANALKGG